MVEFSFPDKHVEYVSPVYIELLVHILKQDVLPVAYVFEYILGIGLGVGLGLGVGVGVVRFGVGLGLGLGLGLGVGVKFVKVWIFEILDELDSDLEAEESDSDLEKEEPDSDSDLEEEDCFET